MQLNQISCNRWKTTNANRSRCGIFRFCLLSFHQNERKMYKLRQLSFTKENYFVKVNIDGSVLKKYTN